MSKVRAVLDAGQGGLSASQNGVDAENLYILLD